MGFKPFPTLGQALRRGFGGGGGGKPIVDTYTPAVVALAPVLWYKFNETSGTAVTNYGSLGAPGNGVWTAGVGALGQTGKLGANNAYSFDGANSQVQTTINAAFSALTDFTVLALVKANTTGEAASGAIRSFGVGNAHQLRLGAGSLLSTVDYDVTDSLQITTAAFPLTSWVWAVEVHSSGTKKSVLYMPAPGDTVSAAALSTDTAGANNIVAQAVDLFIGNRSGQNRTWDGLIDEFILLNFAATVPQIQSVITASAIS